MSTKLPRKDAAHLDLLRLREAGRLSGREADSAIRNLYPDKSRFLQDKITLAWTSEDPQELIKLARRKEREIHYGLLNNVNSPAEAVAIILGKTNSHSLRALAASHPNLSREEAKQSAIIGGPLERDAALKRLKRK